MLDKRWWKAHRTRCADGVCKPSEGAVFKRYGAERSGKRFRYKRNQVSVKKLNESEPSGEVSKRLLVVKIIGAEPLMRKAVAAICLLAIEQPALRWQELYTGFYPERERFPC
jgi:hypothetical protein